MATPRRSSPAVNIGTRPNLPPSARRIDAGARSRLRRPLSSPRPSACYWLCADFRGELARDAAGPVPTICPILHGLGILTCPPRHRELYLPYGDIRCSRRDRRYYDDLAGDLRFEGRGGSTATRPRGWCRSRVPQPCGSRSAPDSIGRGLEASAERWLTEIDRL
jgi:hypothetical protein